MTRMLRTLLRPFRRYAHWLHLQWPAGTVEPLPRVDEHFRTNVPGVYVVGDLAGVPLLKFSLDSGTRAVRHLAGEASFEPGPEGDAVVDVAIIGAGAAGMAAAREARRLGLSFVVLEANRRFATIRDFQAGKPIYTYPKEMVPAGELTVTATVKEALVEELERQTADIPVRCATAERVERAGGHLRVVLEDGEPVPARRVIVAIGRSGNFRPLNVPGEDLGKVHHRLLDPAAYAGQRVLVVGGGDTALEAAVALVDAGVEVTLSYRRAAFVRPRPENVAQVEARQGRSGPGSLRLLLESEVLEILPDRVRLRTPNGEETLPNDSVFAMTGREAPLDFFRRSGIALRNDWGSVGFGEVWQGLKRLDLAPLRQLNMRRIGAMSAFILLMVVVYNWKGGGVLYSLHQEAGTFPFSLGAYAERALPADSWFGILVRSAQQPAFWYTLAYSLIVVVFGMRRIRRRRTPYVTAQTLTLMAVQVVPLFLLPELVLPWLEKNGYLAPGFWDALFPRTEWAVHGREFWRAYGLILAWPLSVYNVFTTEPLWWWLGICFVQTFVLIPGLIYFWGKGAYCGWICSCGALAETLGDTHRDKMPHGEAWNRFNLAGQVILAVALVLLCWRVLGWIWPGSVWEQAFNQVMFGQVFGIEANYKWIVDTVLAGMIGYGVYFWLSGRFWCRFLCPLAALMHIYARFSRFRILADKQKCISCNVCTSVCHQGIDVMSFAQRGLPMEDPQCVRCSACVQSCPTGVLTFGQVDRRTGVVVTVDELEASLARIREEHGR